MREVPEGKRTDICHFECVYNIPPVSISDLKTFENNNISITLFTLCIITLSEATSSHLACRQ